MTVLILIILGLCFGSFINALVWRLKNKKDWVKERSVCTTCKHQLAPKDLIPVLSWIELRGKCRYCNKKIDDTPLPEILLPILFVVSYLNWPYGFDLVGWLLLSVWLIALVLLLALLIYDLRWMILPNALVYALIAVATSFVILRLINEPFNEVVISSIAGVLCSAGLFYLIFQFSSGKWIGGGDVKLSIAIGLFTGGPINAFLMLFIASLSGSIISLPLLLLGKAKRTTQIPFGPFLIIATFIVFLFGADISLWYERVFLGL